MNDSSARKAAAEWADLDAFLRDSGLGAEVFAPARDPPDFILEIKGRRIGLEHTRFFRDTGELADASEWLRFNELLRAERSKGPMALDHILVTAFLKGPLPPKPSRPSLAAALVSVIRAELPLALGEERSIRSFDSSRLLATCVEELQLIQARSAKIINWDVSQATFLWSAATSLIADCIARKTPARSASETVDELWLLITANASSVSSTAPDTNLEDLAPLQVDLERSGFVRVYFHDVLTRSVLEWHRGTGWIEAPGIRIS